MVKVYVLLNGYKSDEVISRLRSSIDGGDLGGAQGTPFVARRVLLNGGTELPIACGEALEVEIQMPFSNLWHNCSKWRFRYGLEVCEQRFMDCTLIKVVSG